MSANDNAKVNIMAWIAYAIVWISAALAISVAVYITKSATPLWGFFFPCCIQLKNSK